MPKNVRHRITPILALALGLGALGVFMLGLYGLTRFFSRGEVMGRVTVADAQIGGMDLDLATSTLLVVEDIYASRPAVFDLEGKFVSLDPHEAGFDVDESAILEEAMTLGRTGNPASQFVWWLGHILSTVELPLRGSVDEDDIDAVFEFWDQEVISMPSNPGGIDIVDGVPEPTYPARGTGVDRPTATVVVTASLLAPVAEQVSIPTTEIEPRLTVADVDTALAEAEAMLAGPITLTYNGASEAFSVEQLVDAFRSVTEVEGDSARIVNSFDPETVDSYLTEVRSVFEDEPIDAVFRISGETVAVIPGEKGTRIDEEETARELQAASLTEDREGVMPVVEGADPDVTTEYLESLNVHHVVSQFTTYHSCCEPRVNNIQTFANAIDQVLVLPGKTFSLNEYVGERTVEKGYLPAPTIIGGEIEDTIGGGVSQFATTFYNAVFWGGFEDIEHKPHSYYFSRYPEGIEATISWRAPDLVFRNDSPNAILIDTLYTDSSITVRFFSENDGRTIKGEQSGGRRKVWVAAEGGPDALHVKGSVSERYAFTQPGEPEYRENPDLDVDAMVQIQSAAGGWSVTVTRTILRGGTDLVDEHQWVVRYLPKRDIFEVHPCKVPGTATACPTTTTIPPTTTTTVPTSTTTTASAAG